MKINVRRYSSDFRSKASNLVCKHTRSWCFNGVIPVVIVVAQSISKVQNGHLADVGWILRNVEVSRLDTSLSNWVRHQEKVEFSVNNFRLFYKALIDVGTLRRIIDELLAVIHGLLEKSLTDSFVYDNERNFRRSILWLGSRLFAFFVCLVWIW